MKVFFDDEDINPCENPIFFGITFLTNVIFSPIWFPLWCIGKIACYIKRSSK